VMFALGGLALVSSKLSGRIDMVGAVTATAAVLGCLAVPALTVRLERLPTPSVEPAAARRDHGLESQFTSAAGETDYTAAMPSDDEVWTRVHRAALTRAGLLIGLAAVVVGGAAALLHHRLGLAALAFALVCGAVLALRAARAQSLPERAALAVAATALTLIACVQIRGGPAPLPLTGVGVLVVIAVLGAAAGLSVAGGRLPGWMPTAAAYLEYATVAALIPLVIWALW